MKRRIKVTLVYELDGDVQQAENSVLDLARRPANFPRRVSGVSPTGPYEATLTAVHCDPLEE